MQTEIAVAFVGLGSTLAGAAIAFAGVAFQQWVVSRRQDQGERDRLLHEVLVAATILPSGVGMMRSSWVEGPSRASRIFKPPRDAMVDMNSLLMPKYERLVQALIAISLWSGKKNRALQDAGSALADAAAALMAAMGHSADAYKESVETFEKALGRFRRAIDGGEAARPAVEAPADPSPQGT